VKQTSCLASNKAIHVRLSPDTLRWKLALVVAWSATIISRPCSHALRGNTLAATLRVGIGRGWPRLLAIGAPQAQEALLKEMVISKTPNQFKSLLRLRQCAMPLFLLCRPPSLTTPHGKSERSTTGKLKPNQHASTRQLCRLITPVAGEPRQILIKQQGSRGGIQTRTSD
jgi:hypothetical protein